MSKRLKKIVIGNAVCIIIVMGNQDNLTNKRCEPCSGKVTALTEDKISELITHVEGWDVIDNKKIRKEFRVKDFAAALKLVNTIGAIAEQENHHPDIYFTWGKVIITIWTHKIGGLTENDFILAAKIDQAAVIT